MYASAFPLLSLIYFNINNKRTNMLFPNIDVRYYMNYNNKQE